MGMGSNVPCRPCTARDKPSLAFLDVSISFFLVFNIMISMFPLPSHAISSCNGLCRDLNDCEGQFICINGKCNDDPDIGIRICPSPAPGGRGCNQYGTLTCNGRTYPTYKCSPPVTSSTPAKLTNNDFSAGWDGGGASYCDGKYHSNSERIMALSAGWFDNWSRCGKMIRIRASNGRSVVAKVVDECDSMRGCDEEHAFEPPCKNDIVECSDAVWTGQGLGCC